MECVILLSIMSLLFIVNKRLIFFKYCKLPEEVRESKLPVEHYMVELGPERKHWASLEAAQARHVAQIAEYITLS